MGMLIICLFIQIDSLSLNQVINIALRQSPAYLASREALAKSRVQLYQTFSFLLPTNTTSANWTHSEFSDLTTEKYTGSTNFSIPIFDLDVVSSIVIAKGQEKGTAIQHEQTVANLMLNLKKSYYNLIMANELLNSSQKAQERAQENKKLVETKYNLGSASRLELLQAEAFYLQTLQNISQVKTLEMQAQQELKSMLNIEYTIYPLDSFIIPDTFILPSLDSLKVILKKANLAINLANQLSSLSKANLWFSMLAFLPKISFFYGYSTSMDSFVFDFDGWREKATKNYGVSVTFPIFEIKSLIFNYLTAKKEVRIKEYNRQKAFLESEKGLYTTYYSLQESIDNLKFAKKSLAVAEEAVVLGREQYSLGVISLLDFLRTEEEYYNVRINLSKALGDFYTNQAELSFLLGKSTIEESK